MKALRSLSPRILGTYAHELLVQACPDKEAEPFFNRNMQRALSLGMTWLEGLQYVIAQKGAKNPELLNAPVNKLALAFTTSEMAVSLTAPQ